MKLGILNTSTLNETYGGVGPFLKNLDPFLNDNYEVTYYCLTGFYNKLNFIPKRLIFVFYLVINFRKLRKEDVLISHVPEGSFVVSYFKIPYVHIFHGNNNPMKGSIFWYGKYFKFIFNHFDKRILKTALIKYTVGNVYSDIKKIVNPILHDVKIKSIQNRKDFVFAGRLESMKNIDRIIKIYNKLPQKIKDENNLIIIGNGSQEKPLKNLTKVLKLENHIKFLGVVNNNKLIDICSNKKIMLMSSDYEGFPMAIAESLSVGVPVISTDVGDINRFIINNINGILLPLSYEDDEYITSVIKILDNYDIFANNAIKSATVFNAKEITLKLSSEINLAIELLKKK